MAEFQKLIARPLPGWLNAVRTTKTQFIPSWMMRWFVPLHLCSRASLFKSRQVLPDRRFTVYPWLGWKFYVRACGKRIALYRLALHIDGLVLARSAFHHSVNYRSVVIFSNTELVTDKPELYTALEVFTNKMQPARWDDDIRQPNDSEWEENDGTEI